MAYLGETITPCFTTQNLTSGALTDADSTPTGVVRRNGVATGVAATVTNRATGRYSVAVTLLQADGWVLGDTYSVEMTWQMAGTTVGQEIAQGRIRAPWATETDLSDTETALTTLLTAIEGAGFTNESLKAIYDSVGLRLATADYVAPDNAGIMAIKSKTDLIPAAGPASAEFYTSARALALDNLDARVSLLLTAAAYTAPDNASITQIKDALDAALLQYTAARAALLDNLAHLDMDISAVSNDGGTGQYTVTLALQDTEDRAVAGAFVLARNATDTLRVAGVYSNSSGLAVLHLDAGTYVLHVLTASVYVPVAPLTRTVSGDLTLPITVELVSQEEPPTVGLCNVYGYVQLNGTAVVGARVRAWLTDPSPVISNHALQQHLAAAAVTDATGRFSLMLIQQGSIDSPIKTYHIEVEGVGSFLRVIPNADTANLADL